jgi:hypothetical protein
VIGTKTPTLAYGAPPRVNLLPHAERERRERADLARRWGGTAVAVVVLMVLASAGMAFYQHSARSSLDRERDRTTALAGELASYRDVSTATRIRSSYQAYRTQAMSTDVAWSPLFAKLRAQMPAGAAIGGFDAVTDPSATPSQARSADAGATAEAAPAGAAVSVTLTLTSRRPLDQKAMLLGFQRIPGVLRVDLESLTSDDYPTYTATTVVYLDDSVYSGRYAQGATR